jgi:hypothetical protein
MLMPIMVAVGCIWQWVICLPPKQTFIGLLTFTCGRERLKAIGKS